MSLFTNLAVVVGDGKTGSGYLDFLQADGTLNATLPADFSGDFNTAILAPVGTDFSLIVPTVATGPSGKILIQYDAAGAFVRELYRDPTRGNGTVNFMAMAPPTSGLLYYLSTGPEAPYFFTLGYSYDGGVHRFDLNTLTELTSFIAINTDAYVAIAVHPITGDVFLAILGSPEGTGVARVERWTAAGTLAQTYTNANLAVAIGSLALDPDGAHFWVGTQDADTSDNVVQRLRIDTGAIDDSIVLINASAAQIVAAPPAATFGNLFCINSLLVQQYDTAGTLVSSDDPLSHSVDYGLPQALVAWVSTPASTTHEAIRFVRRFPFPSDKQLRLFLQRLEFTFQRGVGLATGQGDDPQAMLRISRDGGMTWGPERFLTMGAMGEYVTRMFTTRLGRFRNGVIEIAVSDPVIVAFLDCLADVEEGSS